jgi:hypothetical protein
MIHSQGYKDMTKPQYVYKLQRSLYGLKQSSRQWNHKFDTFLQAFDLVPSIVDICIYHNKGNDLHTIIAIYVDDGIIYHVKEGYIDSIIDHLEKIFKIVKSNVDYFVGLQIVQDPITFDIFIHETRYIPNIISCFDMDLANSSTTLANSHVYILAQQNEADALELLSHIRRPQDA